MPDHRAHELESEKRSAAQAAVAEIEAGMMVGLGTGSTMAFAIEAIGERCRSGLKIQAVATSIATERLALSLGIPIVDFPAFSAVDMAIDGVDEIDPAFRAIKGAGGAMLREKITAQAAKRMIAIADQSKVVTVLGHAPVPIEILPFARSFVMDRVRKLGGSPILRARGGQAVLSDQRNEILDCQFGRIDDPESLAAQLSTIPGVLAHGLFLDEIDALYIGGAVSAGVEKRQAISDRR